MNVKIDLRFILKDTQNDYDRAQRRIDRVLSDYEKKLAKAVEALDYVIAHEHSNLEMNPDVHRHDRYRENMYWKVREALKEIRGEK